MNETRTVAEPTKMAERPSLTRYVRYEPLVAGVFGGVVSTMVLHPLDLLKVRFQGESRTRSVKNGKAPCY